MMYEDRRRLWRPGQFLRERQAFQMSDQARRGAEYATQQPISGPFGLLGTMSSPQVDARGAAQQFINYQASDMVGKGVRTVMDARMRSGQGVAGNGPFVGFISSRFDRGEGLIGRVTTLLFGR